MKPRQRQQWLHLLRAEHARRINAGQARDYREELIAKLDLMAERLRSAPNWVEPSPEEHARSRQELNKWFLEHGYSLRLGED